MNSMLPTFLIVDQHMVFSEAGFLSGLSFYDKIRKTGNQPINQSTDQLITQSPNRGMIL